ncbi:hypothetical protein [Mesorhizobium sp.]|uniref:hypothetical protein n=1 Tax=Mesorhizobium sp. TaxID=1871066 RepID=UPI00121D0D93|nr:hypothetical protein [Mesorhizobium sp.]TIS99269.1 MAG: hypothetical protein E5W87_22530 [Mesorhizobium sp.]
MSKPPIDKALKRPIDWKRESAFSMTIGHDGDGKLTDMVVTTDSMFLVKEHSVHAIKLADQLDPDRTNIDLPNTQQLFADAGSESDIVARTLLSASRLFSKTHFPDAKIRDFGISISADIMTQLLAAQKTLSQLETDEAKQIAVVNSSKDTTRLPAVTEVETRANTFIQKAEHTLQAIYRLAEVFYGPQMKAAGKWPDSLTAVLTKEFGENDITTVFARELAKFAHHVRNTRHCVEHRKDDQRVVARDFYLNLDGTVTRPSITVVHPKTPIDETYLTAFMSAWVGSLTDATETMLLHLAGKNHAPFGNWPIGVGIVPESQRAIQKVRVGYLINVGGQWNRLG